MGTRGAIGFRYKGLDRVTYNHSDSYPSGLGMKAYETVVKFNAEQIAGAAARVHMVEQTEIPSAELQARYSNHFNPNVSTGSMDEWYSLLRDVQGDLDVIIDGTVDHMIDGARFLLDSLFCEWAYILNADTRKLEIYTGFNQFHDATGRYARYSAHDLQGEYWGVALLCEIEFDLIRRPRSGSLMTDIEQIVRECSEEDLTPGPPVAVLLDSLRRPLQEV